MDTRAHADFGPSGLKSYELCAAKWRMEQGREDKGSSYAARGTWLHGVAERCLLDGTLASVDDGGLTADEAEMVNAYVKYCRDLAHHYEVEVRVAPIPELEHLIWGTADFIGFEPRRLHVADLKTGSGVPVSPVGNIQLAAYGLGALEEFNAIHGPFDTAVLHIVQPSIGNTEAWEIPVEELRAFGPRIEQIIQAAQDPTAPFSPSVEACRFCKAKAECRARAEENLGLARFEFAKPETLSDAELVEVLSKADHISKWASDVAEWAMHAAEAGKKLPGYKLVRGRSNRTIADQIKAHSILTANGYDDVLTEPKLITLTALEKLVGAKELSELLGDLITKPLGKPTLVPVSDKREELSSTESAVSDFEV